VSEKQTRTGSGSSKRSDSNGDSRNYPSVGQFLRLTNLGQFAYALNEGWLFSRKLILLAAGLPFLLVLVAGIAGFLWVRHSTLEPVLLRYEEAYNNALKSGDTTVQETCLKALCNLRPSEPQYRLRLGNFYVATGRTEEGYTEIARLAPPDKIGSFEARLWLVRQAMTEQPIRTMSNEEKEKQLKMVLESSPRNTEAHRILASLYFEKQEWSLAELHLTEAAKVQPELNLEIAQLKRQMNRPGEDAEAAALRAVAELSQLLEKDRSNARIRIALAKALVLAADYDQARGVLISGLEQSKDDQELKDALADLELMLVERRLNESILNRDGVVAPTVAAVNMSPSNGRGIQLLTLLRTLGAEIEAERYKGVTEFWVEKVKQAPEDPEARLFLCQLQFLAGENAAAVETLRPVAKIRPGMRISLGRLLLEAGEAAEGESLLMTLLEETEKTLQEKPNDPAALIERSEAFLLLKRPEDVRSLLADFIAQPSVEPTSSDVMIFELNGRASLMLFDRLTGYSGTQLAKVRDRDLMDFGDSKPEEILPLLSDAAISQGTAISAIERLSRLSLSPHPAAAQAEEAIKRLRMDGQSGIVALNLLGMHALFLQSYEKAIVWLEQANVLARGRNPMVLNNLATAIIRGRPNEGDRALQLSEQTLALIPENPDALATRGEINVRMARWNDALKDLTQAIQARNQSPEIHRLLEETYRAMKDEKMADVHRRRAEELESTAGAVQG